MSDQHVVFFCNGPARLLMACVIGDEKFQNARKSIILLDQFGYNYERLLPHVRGNFEKIQIMKEKAESYSHFVQFWDSYFNRYRTLDGMLDSSSTLVLFGLRSPLQKHLIRRAKHLRARVEIYAEGVAIDRYFLQNGDDGLVRATLRRLFRRAFDHQHDYDVFYMLNPDIYDSSPYRAKLARMFNLYGSDSFRRYSALMTKDIDMSEIQDYDAVLLGQPLGPLGNQEEIRAQEEQMLLQIVGDRRVLVLPHPVERATGQLEKYRILPNARVFDTGVPSELVMMGLRPSKTYTYASNAAINYAMMNPDSQNYFYPVYRSRLRMLRTLQRSLPNINVSDAFATHTYPGD